MNKEYITMRYLYRRKGFKIFLKTTLGIIQMVNNGLSEIANF